MAAGNLKLLICDDEPWICENLRKMVDWEELSIKLMDSAGDGEEALRIIKHSSPDILLTDINMPFVNGNELIRQISRQFPRMQIIAISGYDDFEFVREALLYGAIDYLLKPVTKKALLEVLYKAVARINDYNRDKEEREKTDQKLLVASSVFQDNDYSLLLNESAQEERRHLISRLELEYSFYTLVIFRYLDLNALSRKRERLLRDTIFHTKKDLEEFFCESNSLIFNNVHSKNEFIVISGYDKGRLDILIPDILESLRKRSGSRIRASVSQSSFSFGEFHSLYSETCLAFSIRRIEDNTEFLKQEETEKSGITIRINPEMEKQLSSAILSGNRDHIKDILFKGIGLEKMNLGKWLVIELEQCLDFFFGLLHQYLKTDSEAILLLEDTHYILNRSLGTEQYSEIPGILDQLIDDIFDKSLIFHSGGAMSSTIKDVCRYIKDNYFRDISLSSLASYYSIDPSYLCRSFKKQTGETIMVYITKTRINKAVEYLRKSSDSEKVSSVKMSLADIADLVGYEEYAYFSRVFKKITGLSPSDYRSELAAERIKNA